MKVDWAFIIGGEIGGETEFDEVSEGFVWQRKLSIDDCFLDMMMSVWR